MKAARRIALRAAGAFRADRSAAVAVEYALVGSLLAVAALVGILAFRDSLAAIFDSFADLL